MISCAPHALRRRSRDARQSRGTVTVEFALVLQLFLAMVFGMIDMSRLMFARWMVSYAVERGGRIASLRSTTTVAQVQTAVATSAALIGLVGSNVTVQINSGSTAFASRAHGDKVQVSTTYTFSRLLPFVLPQATYSLNGSSLTTVE